MLQRVDGASRTIQARYRGARGRREAALRARGVRRLQQAFRRMRVEGRAGRGTDLYRVALLLRKRSQAFVDAFLERARRVGNGSGQGLDRDEFLTAVMDVHAATLCEAQAVALWRGFEEGT